MFTTDPDPRLFDPTDPQPPIDPSIADHMNPWIASGLGALATLLVVAAVLVFLARANRVTFKWHGGRP